MKIGIDGRSLFYGGGTQDYIRNLALNLSKIDQENEYILYISQEKNQKILSELKVQGVEITKIDYPKVLWEQFEIPRRLKKDEVDIYHSTKANAPILDNSDTAHISTFHGMDFRAKMKYLKLTQRLKETKNYLFWNNMCKLSSKKADHIITVSETAKSKIKKYYNVDEEKVSVVPISSCGKYRKKAKKKYKDTLGSYNINGDYILCVSKYTRKKNIETVIRTLERLENKHPDLQLIMAGEWANQNYERKINQMIDTRDLEDKLKKLGFVEEEDLINLYNGASAFFYPSLYEGFGIPLIEAMKCGTPVVTSNRGAIPEVTSEAAINLPPKNDKEFARAIDNILQKEQRKKKLEHEGFDRAREFDWERTARKTLELYNSMVKYEN